MMNHARVNRWSVMVAIASVFTFAAALSAHAQQARTGTANDEVLASLLIEVRGLRGAMEQMASAGPRIQLLTTRLQMQEVRIANMVRRLEAVRDSLASAQRDYARIQAEQSRFETRAASLGPGSLDEREQVQAMVAATKREAALAKPTVDRLLAEETQLTQEITTEQGRWTDISARLDELDRALLAKR
jgi:TolA-binding protein